MKRLLIPILLAMSGCATHNSWSVRDVALESLMVGAIAIDYGQTKKITADCEENNPFIGKCGEKVDTRLYMVTAALAHVLVAHLLDDDHRTMFQAATLGVEGHVIFRNWKNGRGPDLGD